MNITETRLKLEIKRANICIATKMGSYADKIGLGKNKTELNKLLNEIGLLKSYVKSMRYMFLQTANLDIDVIAWQSVTTVRYTFNSIPTIYFPSGYNVLNEVGVGDTLSVTLAGTAANNGEFTISAVGGTSDVLTSLDVDTILWQNDFTVRYTFNGSPNLSSVSVSDNLVVTLADNDSNNGTFRIRTINDSSDYVDVINTSRIDDEDDEATDAPAVCDITTPIDFLEVGNAAVTDATDDEATDSPAVGVVKFAQRNYTDVQISSILEHINELCKHEGKSYIVTG